jgi:hypothetical protein
LDSDKDLGCSAKVYAGAFRYRRHVDGRRSADCQGGVTHGPVYVNLTGPASEETSLFLLWKVTVVDFHSAPNNLQFID